MENTEGDKLTGMTLDQAGGRVVTTPEGQLPPEVKGKLLTAIVRTLAGKQSVMELVRSTLPHNN